jgi:Arc/MetJ-type ribon-helix-helix transcriptional regulator
MTSVRLPKELQDKLAAVAKREKLAKSDLIKEALEKYLAGDELKARPFVLGEELFGNYGSGTGDRSVTYKQKVRAKISAKLSR